MNAGYNDNLPWQDTVNGVAIKRVRRMNFYCLLPKEVGAGAATPYVISFKSTSFRAGRQMYTQMYMRNARQGLAPCAFLFKVGGEKEKNDKGTFIVPNVELSRPVNPDEYKEALSWFKQIKKGGTKVDESDVHTEAADVADAGPMTSTGAF